MVMWILSMFACGRWLLAPLVGMRSTPAAVPWAQPAAFLAARQRPPALAPIHAPAPRLLS